MTDLKTVKGYPAPAPVTLAGRFVTLVPYDKSIHLQALWDAFGGMDTNALLQYFFQDDFTGIDAFESWLDTMQSKSGWVTLVFRDNASGEALGMANYMRADPANGVVEVGGVAHSKRLSRSPLSTEAHYLMAKHVFEELGYRRYEWKCHNDNLPSKVTAERYGFSFEGIFRQHMISKGANRDTAWFSMIDKEWPLLSSAFEAWLAPENFDDSGTQIRKLQDIRAALTEAQSA